MIQNRSKNNKKWFLERTNWLKVSAQASLQQLCAGVQPIGPCPGPLLSRRRLRAMASPLLLLLRLVIAYINDTDKHTFGRRPAPELLPSPKGLGW